MDIMPAPGLCRVGVLDQSDELVVEAA
jgi:hypothetical protein